MESAWLFGEPDGSLCRRFVERAFLAKEILREQNPYVRVGRRLRTGGLVMPSRRRSWAPCRLVSAIAGRHVDRPLASAELVHSRAPTVTEPVHDRILLRQRLSNKYCGVDDAVSEDIRARVGHTR